jgi:hypothetical protein
MRGLVAFRGPGCADLKRGAGVRRLTKVAMPSSTLPSSGVSLGGAAAGGGVVLACHGKNV